MFNWIAKIAIAKGINRGAKTVLALLAGGGVLEALQKIGITVTINQDLLAASIGGVLLALYEVFRNYQKSKGAEAPQLP